MLQVKIISCSNYHAWYRDISKIKEDDKNRQHEKIFKVEEPVEGYYRTVEDVAGPNVKGFINVSDVILL